jgi:hypothetical protein
MASSNWAFVCAADICSRTRACPFGETALIGPHSSFIARHRPWQAGPMGRVDVPLPGMIQRVLFFKRSVKHRAVDVLSSIPTIMTDAWWL